MRHLFRRERPRKDNSLTYGNPLELARCRRVHHFVISIDGQLVLQEYEPGLWSTVCAVFFEVEEPEWAPELFLLGQQYFGGAIPFVVLHSGCEEGSRGTEFRCEHIVISRVEFATAADAEKAKSALAALVDGPLKLFSYDSLDDVQWATVGCEECGYATMEVRCREALEEECGKREIPALRRPWMVYGWTRQVHEWLARQQVIAGHNFTTHVIKNWSEGCVLHVRVQDMSNTRLFFKACLLQSSIRRDDETNFHEETFASDHEERFYSTYSRRNSSEAGLHCELFKVDPTMVAGIVAACVERGWILMEHAGATYNDIKPWNRLPFYFRSMHRYGQFQLETSREEVRAELLGAGARDMSPRQMFGHFEDCVARNPNLPGFREFIDSSLMDKARAALEALHERVPCSIVHSDLHEYNCLQHRDGSLRLIDFGEAVVSCPFFDGFLYPSNKIERIVRRFTTDKVYIKSLELRQDEGRELAEMAKPSFHIFQAIRGIGEAESTSLPSRNGWLTRWASRSCVLAARALDPGRECSL